MSCCLFVSCCLFAEEEQSQESYIYDHRGLKVRKNSQGKIEQPSKEEKEENMEREESKEITTDLRSSRLKARAKSTILVSRLCCENTTPRCRVTTRGCGLIVCCRVCVPL